MRRLGLDDVGSLRVASALAVVLGGTKCNPVTFPSVFVLALLISTAHAEKLTREELQDPRSNIGFSSVAKVREHLQHSNAQWTNLRDSLVAAEIGTGSEYQLWILTKEGNPAHPAALKYEIREYLIEQNYIQLSSLCEGDEDSCATLFNKYEAILTTNR